MAGEGDFWRQQHLALFNAEEIVRVAKMNPLQLHLERVEANHEIGVLEGEISEIDARKNAIQQTIEKLERGSVPVEGNRRTGSLEERGLIKSPEEL